MSIHSFIHSGHFYFKSSTTQRRSRLQNGYCIGVSRRSAQATAGKGPYVTARAGVEPTTLRLRVIASTNAPSRPKADQKLFQAIRDNPHHVLYRLLPELKKTGYNTRARAHNFVLPPKANTNFLPRMLPIATLFS